MDDIDIWSHTNDTIGQVRRQVLCKIKASSNIKVDLYANGELLDPVEDKRLISQIPLREKSVSFNLHSSLSMLQKVFHSDFVFIVIQFLHKTITSIVLHNFAEIF